MFRKIFFGLGAVAIALSADVYADNKRVLTHGKENLYEATGIRFNKFHVDDRLLYSVDGIANKIYIIDAKSGKILDSFITNIPSPDDLDIGPDTTVGRKGITRGTIYYTVANAAGIGTIAPDGTQGIIAATAGIPHTNGISFSPDGQTLYFSQVFNGISTAALYKVTNLNTSPTMQFIANIAPPFDSVGGGLEGFVTSGTGAGTIYAPLLYKGTLVKIAPVTGNITNIPSNKGILYGATHTALDSKGRLLASDIMGRLIRVNNLQTGSTKVLRDGDPGAIDTVAVNSKDKIYFSTSFFGGIQTCQKTIIKPGFSTLGGITVLGKKLFVSDLYLCNVYSKKSGRLRKFIQLKDWMPDPTQFNFGTNFSFNSLASMPNGNLLATTILPSGRFSIFDVKCLNKITQLNPSPNLLPGAQFPTAGIALDDFTLIVCGLDFTTSPPHFIEKITLNPDYTINTVTPLTVTSFIPLSIPVALAKSPDGSQVWVSDYTTGIITEVLSDTPINPTHPFVLPQGIALAKDGKHLLVLEESTKSLKAIDLQNLSTAPTVVADHLGSLNVNPFGTTRLFPEGIISGVTVDQETGKVYVAASGAKKLWEIDLD